MARRSSAVSSRRALPRTQSQLGRSTPTARSVDLAHQAGSRGPRQRFGVDGSAQYAALAIVPAAPDLRAPRQLLHALGHKHGLADGGGSRGAPAPGPAYTHAGTGQVRASDHVAAAPGGGTHRTGCWQPRYPSRTRLRAGPQCGIGPHSDGHRSANCDGRRRRVHGQRRPERDDQQRELGECPLFGDTMVWGSTIIWSDTMGWGSTIIWSDSNGPGGSGG